MNEFEGILFVTKYKQNYCLTQINWDELVPAINLI